MTGDLENLRGAVHDIAEKARGSVPTKVYIALWCDAATWEAEVDDPNIRYNTVFDLATPQVGKVSLTMSDEWLEACKKVAIDECVGRYEGMDAEDEREARGRLSGLRWEQSHKDKLHIWCARPVGEMDSPNSTPEIVLVIKEVPIDG